MQNGGWYEKAYVDYLACLEGVGSISNLFMYHVQGALVEGEGSVQLTS